MKRDRIPINKDLIPYVFTINLFNASYKFEIRYNETADFFTIGLYGDDSKLLCIEPIVYGVALFEQSYQPGIYPAVNIVPLDESGETDVVNWENFGKTVFLTIDGGGD